MVSEEGIEKALEDIETLKKELNELKIDHVAVIKQLRQEILKLKMLAAASKINSDAQTCSDIIKHQFPNKKNLTTQILTDAATAKAKLESSANPIHFAAEFHNKWCKILDGMGANTVEY